MRGIGGVGPVDAAQRHDPQGRFAVLHHADLHGARLRPEEQRVGGLRHGQVEVVERVPCGVFGGDRQGLEVVPLVLDFGAVDALESEPAHDLLHAADRARDRMEMPEADRLGGQRDVDGRHGRSCRGGGDAGLGRLEARRDRILGVVEVPTPGRLVGLAESAE